MKTVAKLALLSAPFLYAALFPPSVGAQAPLMTGTGPSIEAHAGFEHFAVRLDLGYARASDVLSSGHHSDILSYLAGPVCYPFATRRLQAYVQFLAGGARVTGVTPYNQGQFITGYANKFAWAGGGGFQIRTSSDIAIRLGGDYLHTSYFDPNATLHGQGNLRAVVSFVYFLGRNSGRSY